MALAACSHDSAPSASLTQPRGATVAFEIIDGLPPGQFQTLVKILNDEAQTRRLAVMSRESPSTYRVRGALTITIDKRNTTVAWTWDVFDGDERLALRIAGNETAKVRHRDAWDAADDAMLRRIANSSMEQLAAFLTAPAATAGPAVALSGPDAAGEGVALALAATPRL